MKGIFVSTTKFPSFCAFYNWNCQQQLVWDVISSSRSKFILGDWVRITISGLLSQDKLTVYYHNFVFL
jgi:hypothetical protein